MSVYNGETYLSQAISSILNQTYQDFEFIIVNDGSIDSSRDIILSYCDPRIKYVENRKNIGLTKSLNRGLSKTKCKFVARMDADDISLPQRFETQMSIMDTNEVDICGSAMEVIDGNGSIVGKMGPKYIVDSDLPASVVDRTTWLLHPTIFMKLDALKEVGGYNSNIQYSQDFDLWCRMFLAGKKAIVIPEVLVQYRQHSDQISKVFVQKQCYNSGKIVKKYIASIMHNRKGIHTDNLLHFFLIAKPELAKEKVFPSIKLREILFFRSVFRERFLHINKSFVGLDKRISRSALFFAKDKILSLEIRIKMFFLYIFAKFSIYRYQNIFILFYKLINKLYGYFKKNH